MGAAGRLNKRAAFREPFEDRDRDRKVVQRYDLQFEIWANLLPVRGGEQVMQARMTARSPAIVTVRASAQSRRITPEWQVTIDGRKYDVKEAPRETPDRSRLEMLVEARV